jgi:hypothetical protein
MASHYVPEIDVMRRTHSWEKVVQRLLRQSDGQVRHNAIVHRWFDAAPVSRMLDL